MKKSFARQIKYEILEKEYTGKFLNDLLYGVFLTSEIKNGESIIQINNSEISDEIRRMLEETKIEYKNSKENKNYIVVKNFPFYKDKGEVTNKSMFFAGVFLACGSISRIESISYHLELTLPNNESTNIILELLNRTKDFQNISVFKFNKISRRGKNILYLKKGNEISDFLKVIQVTESVLDFEEERILRDISNFNNRYSNLDILNTQRVVDSQFEFEEMYNTIKKNNLLIKFREAEINFMKLKINEKDIALTDLAILYNKKYGTKKTKSGLNHWIIKMRKIYDSI